MVRREIDAVVVGAGFAGMYMSYLLRKEGYDVQGIEAAADVGGTWFWNRYPGARCDIPSLLYQYSWNEEIRTSWRWSEKYATQPEILAYANHCADLLDIRPLYRFQTRVTKAEWDEAADRWLVDTDKGEALSARYLVMATGALSVPKEPDFPGLDRFKGPQPVTGRWPHEGVDFKGKRVAVVGTGSSAIQSLPHIAADAAQVYVFQRTPNFSLPALNAPIPDEEREAFEAAWPLYKQAIDTGEPGVEMLPEDWEPSDEELAEHVKVLWNGGGLVSTVMIPRLTKDERINEAACEFVRSQIRAQVNDPVLAEKLSPRSFPISTKRACVDTDYYVTYNRENVTLVDLNEGAIVEVTEKGIRTTNAEYEVDVIVWALGFDAMTGALTRVDIRGKDGTPLKDAWHGGPAMWKGMMVAGFPNLFTITGPGSPSVLMNVILAGEHNVEFIADVIDRMREQGETRVEVSEAAQEAWVDHVRREAEATLFPRANSWYMGANIPGKPRVMLPYVGIDYKKRLNQNVAAGFPGLMFEG
ncbi:NAD(P)/FAD-dependent oxidoreductase [Novosphingobium sp. KCTC 2891]|uniref:flavin-containing monooxygenase n=1 Tax=Novosphingobium sp. KCTC 2891 TaxID=2989730 RepID=UPI0022214E50|nr:NAD(P)/FAD-dependent oxidoreductase [Novosphingobium sp. KCTC 2891]MCW1384122.1 NAD(P)/FAD-dependent oxidoreductase [Novosphingobium sp. KCTC 2891]